MGEEIWESIMEFSVFGTDGSQAGYSNLGIINGSLENSRELEFTNLTLNSEWVSSFEKQIVSLASKDEYGEVEECSLIPLEDNAIGFVRRWSSFGLIGSGIRNNQWGTCEKTQEREVS